MTHLIIHRGIASKQYKENLLKSFKQSFKKGYGIETDIHVTKDNEFICFHDFTLNRIFKKKESVKNMKYSQINDVGKQWIRKFGLALARESLGSVRGKYGNIPIPNGETTLDGDALRNEAVAEKEALKAELREMLEKTSQRNLLEADRDGAQMLQEKLGKVPLPIYVG